MKGRIDNVLLRSRIPCTNSNNIRQDSQGVAASSRSSRRIQKKFSAFLKTKVWACFLQNRAQHLIHICTLSLWAPVFQSTYTYAQHSAHLTSVGLLRCPKVCMYVIRAITCFPFKLEDPWSSNFRMRITIILSIYMELGIFKELHKR